MAKLRGRSAPQPFLKRRFELSVEQDCLLWRLRVITPTGYQEDILEELLTGHPGIVQMKETAGPYLSWTNIDQEIKQAVRSCGSCQQVRKPPAAAPLTPWLRSSNPWYRVHITLRTKMGINSFSLTHILAGLRSTSCGETYQQRQINVVIISDKIFKTKIFKCDSINVFTIGESTRCCEWIVFLFGCHPSTYEKGTLFFIFSEVYSCLSRLRFPGWNS